jgi:hypothetical protein
MYSNISTAPYAIMEWCLVNRREMFKFNVQITIQLKMFSNELRFGFRNFRINKVILGLKNMKWSMRWIYIECFPWYIDISPIHRTQTFKENEGINSPHLSYSGDIQFEFQSRHCLFWPMISVIFLGPSIYIPKYYLRSDNSFQFITN